MTDVQPEHVEESPGAKSAARRVKRQEPAAEAGEASAAPVPQRYIVLLFQGPGSSIEAPLFSKLRDMVDDSITTPRELTEIDLWLDSPGGDAHAAYKIALLLRAKAHRLRVVVRDYAKSAATLLSLAADEIYMGEAAELGPLDAQIQHEKEGMVISALDIAKSMDDLGNTALRIALNGGAAVLQMTQLSRVESLNATLDFAAKFMAPVVGKIDPPRLHWSSSLLEVAVHYAERLLAMRESEMDVTQRQLPRRLVERYPTHGCVISREEAAKLGLPVRPLDGYDYFKEVVRVHRTFEARGEDLVAISSSGDLDGSEQERTSDVDPA